MPFQVNVEIPHTAEESTGQLLNLSCDGAMGFQCVYRGSLSSVTTWVPMKPVTGVEKNRGRFVSGFQR